MTITLQPGQWERAKAKAAAENVAMITDSGEMSKSGVLVAWNYAAPLLDIEVKKKPWYLPMSRIEATIRESFEAI